MGADMLRVPRLNIHSCHTGSYSHAGLEANLLEGVDLDMNSGV